MLCRHFGHCEKFAIIDADSDAGSVGAVEERIPPPHEPGLLPRWLGDMGVNVVIAGGMGQRAQQLFSARNIEVFVGAPTESPSNLVTMYLENKLEAGENLCDH